MSVGNPESASSHDAGRLRWSLQSHVAITIAWLGISAVVLVLLCTGVRSTDQFQSLRQGLHVAYVVVLLWHLARTGPVVRDGAPAGSEVMPAPRWIAWLPASGVLLLLLLTVVSDEGFDLILLSLIVASIWLLFVWRRRVRVQSVSQGLGVALLGCLAGLPMVWNGFVEYRTILLFAALAVPMYVAGGLLFEETRLGGGQLLQGRGMEALRSFLWGCLLFLPLGLINSADGSPGTGIVWVTEWWMPVALPWYSAIVEEIWFRLFLVGLCFFLLRPVLSVKPVLAVVVAVIFSGMTFGLGHDRTWEGFVTTGLLYGVPTATVFARRDWEHAVGAHYMVNMIPWLTVFLET